VTSRQRRRSDESVPSNPVPRYYWDADVLLSYIEGQDISRLSHIRSLLDDADDRKLEIVTSTFSIVEVAYAPVEKTSTLLDPQIEASIAALWGSGSPVRVVELDALIAAQARQLVREGLANKRRIKPGDAIHLATAMRLGADALHTYNLKDFKRWATPTGLTICNPESSHPQMVAPPIGPSPPSSQSPTAAQT